MKALTLGPLRRGDDGLAFGIARWVNDAKLPTLNLGNHERVLVLSAGVEFDRSKGSHVEVNISDGIAYPGAVEGLGVVDGTSGDMQRGITRHRVMGGMGIVAPEVFGIELLGAGPSRRGQPLHDGKRVFGILPCALGCRKLGDGKAGAGRSEVPGVQVD